MKRGRKLPLLSEKAVRCVTKNIINEVMILIQETNSAGRRYKVIYTYEISKIGLFYKGIRHLHGFQRIQRDGVNHDARSMERKS